MASLFYDIETITKLQNLIDNHKQELNEIDYIKICNLTKTSHETLKQPKLIHEPEYEIPIHEPVMQSMDDMIVNPFWRNGPDIGISYVPKYNDIRFGPSPDNQEIQRLEFEIRDITAGINITLKKVNKKGRVSILDKYNALMFLSKQHNINYNMFSDGRLSLTKKCNTLMQRLTREGVTIDPNIYIKEMEKRKDYDDKQRKRYLNSEKQKLAFCNKLLYDLRN